MLNTSEIMISLRYLRSRRSEGGVGMMTVISLLGITLAVFALIVSMAVRAGFRAEFVDTVLGANAHISVYPQENRFTSYGMISSIIKDVPDVLDVSPVISGQVMGSFDGKIAGMEIRGVPLSFYMNYDALTDQGEGSPERLNEGIALGAGIARSLDLSLGDTLRVVSPDGVRTPFGTSPRIMTWEVVHIFSAGRYDIDNTRAYLSFENAQKFFNKDGVADRIDLQISEPEALENISMKLAEALGSSYVIWTWKDANSSFLSALEMEDNVMFIILSILVLIAALNIVSGLVMLVKNKTRDIGILRTMGFSQGAIMRIFLFYGASVGTLGTLLGTALGIIFSMNMERVMTLIGWLSGKDVWDPSVRGIYELPARIEAGDLALAVGLSIGLSYLATMLPARRAAAMDPVEALRND